MNNTKFYKITYNMNGGVNTNVEKININVLIFLPPGTVGTSISISLQLENRSYSGNELKQLIITNAYSKNIPITTDLNRWHLLDKEGRNIVGENADAKREIIDQSTYKLIPKLLAGPGPA